MKRHLFGTVGSLAAVLLMVGCAEDPTAALRGGGVETVVISRTYVEMDVGESVRLNAKAYDAQGNVLGTLPEVTIDDNGVGDLVIDTVTSGDPLPQTDFDIEAVGAGKLTVTATAGGKTATTTIIAFPTEFTGTITVTASGAGWDLVSLAATNNVKFDPDNTTATIGGLEALIHEISADALVLVHSGVDAVSAGTVSLSNLVFLDQFSANLDASTTVDVAAIQNYLDENYDLAAAPELSGGPFPLKVYGFVSDAVVDVIGQFNPAADLALTSSVYWADHDTDIDVFYTDAGDGFIDCLGCGGSNPETGSWTVAGGDTNYYYVELWSGAPTVFQATFTSP